MKIALLTLTMICAAAVLITEASVGGQSTRVAHPAVDDSGAIFLRRGAFKPPVNAGDVRRSRALSQADQKGAVQTDVIRTSTRLIQFSGPTKPEWLADLKKSGVRIIGYIPNHAYLVKAGQDLLSRLDTGESLVGDDKALRWAGNFDPIQKIDPSFPDQSLQTDSSIARVEVELFNDEDLDEQMDRIGQIAGSQVPSRRFLNYVVLTIAAPVNHLVDIAQLSNVLFIGPARSPRLLDERAAQIVASNLAADHTQPVGPGYLDWLAANHLTATPDFLIDVSDTGLNTGTLTAGQMHPDFLDAAHNSRVSYIQDYAKDGQIDDRLGHGTLVASIAAGYKDSGVQDELGYFVGVGVAPFVKLGASRVFGHDGKMPPILDLSQVESAAYQSGARISNNSWGQDGNLYDATAQQFDALVRDAESTVAGNQEMTFVFAAGNSGAGGHIYSPGTAKNVLTVAASENYRPDAFDTCNLDGLGGVFGSDGGDNAMGLLRFSSGGPTSDGRAKPDISAPGTLTYGAESLSPFYNAGGLCPGLPIYGDSGGQRLYTSSSGTSLAAPQIAGAAALIRQYLVQQNPQAGPQAVAPSPAMIKAYMINSASYMTGILAGDDLPGTRQGWGLVALGRAFDKTPRILVDQTTVFTATGQTFQVQGALADRSQPLRVTLAWTDAPGSLAGAPWVNDLDLEVNIGGQTIYLGNNFSKSVSIAGGEADRKNNVECVILTPDMIPTGVDGNFTITVRAANIAGDGVPGNSIDLDQDFALVVYNAAAPLVDPPPPPAPTITAASYVGKTLTITGHAFGATAQIEINGQVIGKPFTFDSATNSLEITIKARKLNLLTSFDNHIVVIDGGVRSADFILHL